MKRFSIISIFLIFVISTIVFIKLNYNDDTMKLQLENDNFKLYSYNKDKECLNDLLNTLDDNYTRISKDLNTALHEKVIVEIYPDINSFHSSLGQSNLGNWVVGVGWENKIKMVSPLNPSGKNTYDSLKQVLVHEFTHILISTVNSNLDDIPIWLNEGLATYEAKQINDTMIDFIKKRIDNNSIPLLSEMTYDNFAESGGYIFSYTAIEYLINNYGFTTLASLIKEPQSFEAILGITMNVFQDNWISYLKNTVVLLMNTRYFLS